MLNDINQKVVKTPAVAQALGVSVPTVLDWHSKGLIPAVIAEGKVYRWDIEEVTNALRERAKRKGDK